MKKIIVFGILGLALMGCELRLQPVPTYSTTVTHMPTTYETWEVCYHDDPFHNPDLYYEYCSWEDGIYCNCEVYYNVYTGCEEEWCYWDDVCGWEYTTGWCH